jgi:hypothetical protein
MLLMQQRPLNFVANLLVQHNHLCLHGDTLVITDKGRIKIADLVGTEGRVLSSDGGYHDYRNCIKTGESKPIMHVFVRQHANTLTHIRCTYDHKFWTITGWVEAGMLLPGTRLVNAVTGKTSECVLTTPMGKADVYCLNVPDTGNFAIENGVVVSNCDALRYLCMSNMQHAVKLRKGHEEDEEENVVPFRGRNRNTGY